MATNIINIVNKHNLNWSLNRQRSDIGVPLFTLYTVPANKRAKVLINYIRLAAYCAGERVVIGVHVGNRFLGDYSDSSGATASVIYPSSLNEDSIQGYNDLSMGPNFLVSQSDTPVFYLSSGETVFISIGVNDSVSNSVTVNNRYVDLTIIEEDDN